MTRAEEPSAPDDQPTLTHATEVPLEPEPALPPEKQHIAPTRPPEESKYKTLELRSFEVDEVDDRRAPTRKIERNQVQALLDQYGIGGQLPPNSPLPMMKGTPLPGTPVPQTPAAQGPQSQAPQSRPPQSQHPRGRAPAPATYAWLWVAVLLGAAVVGVLVGLVLLKLR
ncbi:MAG: hypothetical protein H6718_27710 [Polyangiaceae bacterium]|nr:hypothetical protein [Myxococcales bacterium]MCB9589232.1 hypothetical protein [Polyangiaceae bacterium]